ncbi:MAG TPA: alpha/beta hydrolase [Rhizomicrobium sp.]|nr:alpha/beta hydrolase [Rhizomicrobium sp.]
MRAFLTGLAIVIALLAGAFWYFSDPDIPRAVLEAKYAKPPSEFIMLPDGARAHVRDQGNRNGPVLVLVHGSNASLFTWEPWVARLGKDYRIVTMDLQGHGLTGAVPNNDYSQEGMVTFVDEVVTKLGISKFALGGNSMGGGVVARYAEEHPDKVSALILVDAAGEPVGQGDHVPLVFQIARMPVLNKVLLYITPRALVKEGLNDAIVHKQIITDKMIDQYWEFARMEGSRQANGIRFQLPWTNDVKEHIGDIKAPTLILWGAEDHLIPVAAAHAFQKDIPGSKLIIYPATGHIPMEEVPDQSAADVRAFLTSVEK